MNEHECLWYITRLKYVLIYKLPCPCTAPASTGLHAASAAGAAGQQPFNIEAPAGNSFTTSSSGKGWGLLNLLIVASSVNQATAEGVKQAASSNNSPVSALLKGATASVLTAACASAAACVSPACDYISSNLDEALSPVTTAMPSAAGKGYCYGGGVGLMCFVPSGGFSLQGSVVGGGLSFMGSSGEDPIATAAARALKVGQHSTCSSHCA